MAPAETMKPEKVVSQAAAKTPQKKEVVVALTKDVVEKVTPPKAKVESPVKKIEPANVKLSKKESESKEKHEVVLPSNQNRKVEKETKVP